MTAPETPALETANLPGGAIAYRKAGSGPTLFCMHGLGGGSASWQRQLAGLSDGFTVVAWDCPGYGGSARRAPNAQSYADAAAQLIDHLALGPVTLIGHSMGGILAPRLAASRPDLVSRLVLSCTFKGEGGDPDGPIGDSWAKRLNERREMDDDSFGLARATGMTGPDVDEETFEIVAAIAGEIRAEGYEDACRVLTGSENSDVLPKLDIPVLVVDAEHDSVVRRDRIEPLVALLPGCARHTMTGVGHAPYIEDAEAYNAMLRGFIAG